MAARFCVAAMTEQTAIVVADEPARVATSALPMAAGIDEHNQPAPVRTGERYQVFGDMDNTAID